MFACKIFVGVGALMISSGLCVAFIGNNNKFKMWTFRRTSKAVNEYISSNPVLMNIGIEMAEPESDWWTERWKEVKAKLDGAKKMDFKWIFSEEAKKDPIKFRDECFRLAGRNKEELKRETEYEEDLKSIWLACLKEKEK